MANSLHRELEEKEVVILHKRYFREEYKAVEERAVMLMGGGFGMHDYTDGTALYVKFLSDGEESRWEGYMIDPIETAEYQAKNGKYIPEHFTFITKS